MPPPSWAGGSNHSYGTAALLGPGRVPTLRPQSAPSARRRPKSGRLALLPAPTPTPASVRYADGYEDEDDGYVQEDTGPGRVDPGFEDALPREAQGYHDIGGRLSLRRQSAMRASGESLSRPASANAKTHRLLVGAANRIVLGFDAVLVERPVKHANLGGDCRWIENNLGSALRRFVVNFFVMDGTIQVLEAQEDNSGVLVSCVGQRRGAFLTRGRVPKPGTRGAASFYEAEDMRVGATLDLHGTRLALTKAVESTREYLQNDPDRADEPFEVDAAEATARDAGDTLVGKPRRSARPEAMSRGPRQKLDPTKTAKDAGFGPLRPCPLPKRRPTSSVERFFAHVHTVLRFVCVYDDPHNLFTDPLRLKLLYWVHDDTIWIHQEHLLNDGREPVALFMKRSKLPKDPKYPSIASPGDHYDADCYHWTDLTVGTELLVYGRKVLLLDADPDTREFYERNGRPLGAASPSKPRRPLPNVAAAVPPSTGFGNEPDSMQSVKSLHAYTPPARTSLARLEKWAKQALRFKLRIIDFRKADSAHTGKNSGKAHLPKMTLNKEREFNLTYFLEDDTIVLFEVPVRNSGWLGGVLLKRAPLMKDAKNYFRPSDFVVGEILKLNHFTYRITDADEFALKYLEARPALYPKSDIVAVRAKLGSHTDRLARRFEGLARTPSRPDLSLKDVRAVLGAGGASLHPHEALTLLRAAGAKAGRDTLAKVSAGELAAFLRDDASPKVPEGRGHGADASAGAAEEGDWWC